MPDYYNELITEKSWQTLLELRRAFDFILIGGWAVYLYTRTLKSKDIDIIVDFDLLSRLREEFQVIKNERLTKYEARRGEVQIDVYLPHYSDIGVPVEKVMAEVKTVEGFKLLPVEMMIILKQLVFKKRGLSAKGRKDRLDILALLIFSEVDFGKYIGLTEKLGLSDLSKELWKLVAEAVNVSELGVNEHKWSKRKKEIVKVLNFVG